MPAPSKPWLLDTSALFCLSDDEPGAETVEKILHESGPKGMAFVCFITLMEYYYVLHQEKGELEARRGYLKLKQLPLKVVESDEELALSAGRIKALSRLSVADAWVAAAAERLQAVLVHKYPEFEQLKGQIPLQALPHKKEG